MSYSGVYGERQQILSPGPMIFSWHPNTAWSPREWITKRLHLRQKVREIAQPHLNARREGNPAAKYLQSEISHLFDSAQRSEKEAHILAWMVVLHMHSELERNSGWSLPLCTHFIFHLSHDLGSVLVMKGLPSRGHSPRLYECEEGYIHYPEYTQTMRADVGNAMYGYVAKHLNLLPDAPNLGDELTGDVVEIAYNLYFMHAALQIDVASLLGVEPTTLAGWWAQVTIIQRDAYIQSAAMLGGEGSDTTRLERVCIYISHLSHLTPKESISVIRGKESHKGNLPCSLLSCV